MTSATDPRADTGIDAALRRRWRRCLLLTVVLMAIGFAVTLGVTFYARDLAFNWFGWPFGFWMAAQGALVIYLALIGIYARGMRELDAQAGIAEDD